MSARMLQFDTLAFVGKKSLAPKKRRSIGFLRCSLRLAPSPRYLPDSLLLRQRGDRFGTSADSDRTRILEAHHCVLNGAERFDAGRIERQRARRRVVGGSGARRGVGVTALAGARGVTVGSQLAINQASRSEYCARTRCNWAARTKVRQKRRVLLVAGPVRNFGGVDGANAAGRGRFVGRNTCAQQVRDRNRGDDQ